jgi:YD repeat-containing protein
VSRSHFNHARYDAINRATCKSYSDGTPPVVYAYDAANVQYSVGRLTAVGTAASVEQIAQYDPLGRILQSTQTTAGVSYSFAYTYNLAGALTAETYPSGRSLTASYNSRNSPNTLMGSFGGQMTPYVLGTVYWPHGELNYLVRGNGVVQEQSFNSRLQQTESYEMAYTVQPNGTFAPTLLFASCPNWGAPSQTNLVCPAGTQASDNGNLLSYVE